MLQNIKKRISGYSYKTLNIPMNATRDEYNIATQYDLGLPANAVVFGFCLRKSENSTASIVQKTSTGRDLVYLQCQSHTLINLKDINTNSILVDFPLGFLNKPIVYIEPRLAGQIDWERSTINITKAGIPFLAEDTDYELTVLYFSPMVPQPLQDSIMLKGGRNLLPIRTRFVEVLQNASQIRYSISRNSDIGIDQDDILIGFDNSVTGDFPINGVKTLTRSLFLTLKQSTNAFIDQFPLQTGQNITYPQMDFEQTYKPITPVRVGSIDWQNSSFEVTNPSDLTVNGSMGINLFYVRSCDLI